MKKTHDGSGGRCLRRVLAPEVRALGGLPSPKAGLVPAHPPVDVDGPLRELAVGHAPQGFRAVEPALVKRRDLDEALRRDLLLALQSVLPLYVPGA